MRKPKISDASGWEEWDYGNKYKFVKIFVPTGLTVSDAVTRSEKRFSYVPADMVLRNWYKVSARGHRDKYFYGEMAYQESRNYARDLDWDIEKAENGWS